jgi:hypothetical protein
MHIFVAIAFILIIGSLGSALYGWSGHSLHA